MKYWIYIAMILALAACRESDELDPVPTLEFISISETEVTQFENAIDVTVKYVDMDGDLGQPDPDALSMRVKDDRLEDYDWYHIPPLDPDDYSPNISGNFVVELPPLFLLGNGSQEVTKITIQVQDRAGNWSNPVETPEIIINE